MSERDGQVQVGLRMPRALRDQIEAAAKADDFTNTSEWIRVQLVRRCREVLEDAPSPAHACGGAS